MEEKKNDSSLMVIIIVGVVLIAAIIGFLIYNQAKNNKDEVTEPNTAENGNANTENLDNEDVAGAYRGTYTTTDVTNDKDATDTDDTDIDDITNDQDATDDNDTATGTTSIELVLDKDGTAKFAKGDEIMTGNYTITNRVISLVVSRDADTNDTDTNAGTTNTTNKTYNFTVNTDDTLSYTDDDSARQVTLTKTNKDNLDYIK